MIASKKSYGAALQVLIIIWTLFIADFFFPGNWKEFFCLVPRDIHRWYAIFTSWAFHAGWQHITANSIAIAVLTWLLFAVYKKEAFGVWLLIMIFSGAGTWLIGRSGTCHLGISGMIFGLAGFFIGSGIFRRTFKDILIGLVLVIFYGGTIWSGLIPQDPHISWEGHLSGLIAGLLVAYLFRNAEDKN